MGKHIAGKDTEKVPRLAGWLTLTEAAQKLGISRQAVHQKAARREFRTLRALGKGYVVREAEVGKMAHSAPAITVIGGVPGITAPVAMEAYELIANNHSTQVIMPLRWAGHPLAEMNYHVVSAEHLASHPDLIVPKGTPTDQHGQVKIAVLHYLAETVAALAMADGQAALATRATKEAAAVVALAGQLTQAA